MAVIMKQKDDRGQQMEVVVQQLDWKNFASGKGGGVSWNERECMKLFVWNYNKLEE